MITLNINSIETWIDNVCASHSNSNKTRDIYSLVFNQFCNFIGKTANQIKKEYNASTDRDFKREHAQYVRAFISAQQRKEMAPSSISTKIGIIKSFFKYNDLPLGFIPTVKPRMLYHNRDITHEEIKMILNASRPRERAFYTIMTQSGLRPNTICNLKYENIKEDFENNIIPCKIDIPEEIAKGKYHSYFTFVGEESIKNLKSYLVIRPKINDEDYLFLSDDNQQNASPKSISKFFAQTVKKLHEKDLMALKQKKETKPHDVRLYNLRKFFRKYANQAGFEFVQFWMGHTVNAGQDDHYRPKDEEFHRKLYAENAMPHLRIETTTPTDADKAITELRQENKKLKDIMQKIYEKVFPQEIACEKVEREMDEYTKYYNEHPEEFEKEFKQPKEEAENWENDPANQELIKKAHQEMDEYQKYYNEHPEELKKERKQAEEEWIRSDERRKGLRKIQSIIEQKKTKNTNKQNDTA